MDVFDAVRTVLAMRNYKDTPVPRHSIHDTDGVVRRDRFQLGWIHGTG
jgi:hypothetical protein